jgi:hypothetical protein
MAHQQSSMCMCSSKSMICAHMRIRVICATHAHPCVRICMSRWYAPCACVRTRACSRHKGHVSTCAHDCIPTAAHGASGSRLSSPRANTKPSLHALVCMHECAYCSTSTRCGCAVCVIIHYMVFLACVLITYYECRHTHYIL